MPLVTGDGAFAVQISEVPNCPFERLTSVHVSPAPDTVSVWRVELVGPLEDANSTSSSSVDVVLNAGVVTVPTPSIEIVLSTVRTPPVGAGPDDTSSDTALPVGTSVPATGD